MVRRKVEIKKIEDKAKRHTTFTKRRQGLFKKAKDLSDRSGDEVAIIAFSLAGNVYAFGSPSVDSIVERYENTDVVDHGVVAGVMAEETTEDDEEEEESDEAGVVVVKEEVEESGEVVVEAEEEAEEEGCLEELDQLEAAAEYMKKKVSALAKHMIKKM